MRYQVNQNEIKYQLIKSDYCYKKIPDVKFITWAKEINDGLYDFSKLKFYTYESRRLGTYKDEPKELALVNHISSKINTHFKISYYNRNLLMRDMINNLLALKRMNDFTIIKFDFKKYFPSVSTNYVYEYYIKESLLSRDFKTVIKKYCESIAYCIPGISLSNTFSELIAIDFDEVITKKLYSFGILYYKRYVDDVVILINNHISKVNIQNIIEESIEEVFYKKTEITKNRTKVNLSKFQVINKRSIKSYNHFNFLGYEFTFVTDNDFKIGITNSKIQKYTKKIMKLIKNTHKNPILLRHVIRANVSRIVYCTSRDEKKALWKVKGIVSNYIELRRFPGKIDHATIKFLSNIYFDIFTSLGISIPHYLHSKRYQLLNNIMRNRTMIFDEKIGVDIDTIKSELTSIGCKFKPTHSYVQLVRNYLISVKVGH